jgi:MFS-type transporter involved in bile tolerance (Atg22 family)
MADIGMFLGPITVTYITDYSGNQNVTFMPFLAPAILAFAVGVLMIWAQDPARRRHAEEYMVE